MAAAAPFRYLALLGIILLATLAGVSGCGGPDARRATHMARGQQYLSAGNLEKARIEFNNALQIAPNDAEARFMAGQVAEQLGNLRGAAGHYQAALEASADQTRAAAALARLFIYGGAPQRALAVLKPALLKHPDDADLLAARGAARAQLQNLPAALIDAQRAVQLAPANENAVALLASIYRVQGEQPRAVELVSHALQQRPDSISLHQVLADLYVLGGDSAHAEEQLRRVTQLKPQELKTWLALAAFYTNNKRLDEAQGALQAAMLALPKSDSAKLAYGDFLATYRSRAQGEQALRQLIAREPRNYELQLGLGALLQRNGAPAEAIAAYRQIISADPGGAHAMMARDRIAAIEAARGNYAEALALLATTLQKSPRDTDALTLRGNIALERGDPVTAVADLRAVLREQPEALGVRRMLVRAYLANREPALAEATLREGLQSAPDAVTLRVELAQLLLQTGQSEPAVALLEAGVRASPTSTLLREELVRADLARGDLVAARSAAEDLKTLQPADPGGPYVAGLVAEAQQRPADALREFERALALQPAGLEALRALVRVQLAQGHRDLALARVQAAVAQAPKDADLRNFQGELQGSSGQRDAAADSFRAAIALAPHWWLPYHNLAAAQAAAHEMDASIATCESGLRATAAPSLVVDLATYYERSGRIDEAIAQYEALHQREPRSVVAVNNLAMLLVTYRTDRASLDRARDLTAVLASSDNGALLDTRGWVMFKRGEFQEALTVLERAARQAPDSRVIHYHLAMAELQGGQALKAREHLQSALAGGASFSGSEEARLALARLTGRAG